MGKHTEVQSHRACTIGLPNGLLYARYQVLWNSFFAGLGLQTRNSGPTNREILELGNECSIDETCLSAKLYLGHVRSLLGTCDYILVPRINSWGRQRDMCTRFASLYDLVCNTFRDSGQKFLSCNIDAGKKLTEESAFVQMGEELGFSKKIAENAYHQAKKEDENQWKIRLRKEEALYREKGIKVMIAAHSYIIEDDYYGKPIADYLRSLDLIPIRADITDRKEALKQSLKVSPTLKWEWNREIIGSLQMHREQIDGIVLVSAFPCGPDSMTDEIVSRHFAPLPVLRLVLDTQTGTAGIETRLESFADILSFQKKGGLAQ